MFIAITPSGSASQSRPTREEVKRLASNQWQQPWHELEDSGFQLMELIPAELTDDCESREVIVSERWGALLSRKEACIYLSIRESKFNELVASGHFQGVMVASDRLIRYKKSDLDDFIQRLPTGRGKKNFMVEHTRA